MMVLLVMTEMGMVIRVFGRDGEKRVCGDVRIRMRCDEMSGYAFCPCSGTRVVTRWLRMTGVTRRRHIGCGYIQRDRHTTTRIRKMLERNQVCTRVKKKSEGRLKQRTRPSAKRCAKRGDSKRRGTG